MRVRLPTGCFTPDRQLTTAVCSSTSAELRHLLFCSDAASLPVARPYVIKQLLQRLRPTVVHPLAASILNRIQFHDTGASNLVLCSLHVYCLLDRRQTDELLLSPVPVLVGFVRRYQLSTTISLFASVFGCIRVI